MTIYVIFSHLPLAELLPASAACHPAVVLVLPLRGKAVCTDITRTHVERLPGAWALTIDVHSALSRASYCFHGEEWVRREVTSWLLVAVTLAQFLPGCCCHLLRFCLVAAVVYLGTVLDTLAQLLTLGTVVDTLAQF